MSEATDKSGDKKKDADDKKSKSDDDDDDEDDDVSSPSICQQFDLCIILRPFVTV